MTTRLRPMRWWDIDAVLPLAQELFAGDPPWSAEQFWTELAGVPETRWYIVAEDGADLVGYAGIRLVGPDADVQTLAVASSHQGQGIGGVLLDALLDRARRSGAIDALLEVRAANATARALYEGRGFERIAVRRSYYADGADGLVLRRRLLRARQDGRHG